MRTLNDYGPEELERLRALVKEDTLEANRLAREVLGARTSEDASASWWQGIYEQIRGLYHEVASSFAPISLQNAGVPTTSSTPSLKDGGVFELAEGLVVQMTVEWTAQEISIHVSKITVTKDNSIAIGIETEDGALHGLALVAGDCPQRHVFDAQTLGFSPTNAPWHVRAVVVPTGEQ